jgi:hypothetical protein
VVEQGLCLLNHHISDTLEQCIINFGFSFSDSKTEPNDFVFLSPQQHGDKNKSLQKSQVL